MKVKVIREPEDSDVLWAGMPIGFELEAEEAGEENMLHHLSRGWKFNLSFSDVEEPVASPCPGGGKMKLLVDVWNGCPVHGPGEHEHCEHTRKARRRARQKAS